MPLYSRIFTPRGAPPGAIVPPVVRVPPQLHVLSYATDELVEHDPEDVSELADLLETERVLWIDVHGLGDGSVVSELGELLGLHPLAVADVVHVGQRPKVELYGDVLFVVLRMAAPGAEDGATWEQVSVFLGPGWVLSFQERPGDCLEPLRERIRRGGPRIRAAGPDYLACMIVDAIVDGYFPVIEDVGARLEAFEDELLEGPSHASLATIHGVRRELMSFRRAVWPLRDALAQLSRDDSYPVSDPVRVYLRDTMDHVLQAADVNETYRELSASLMELYLSRLGQRTNEIMRVLTVVAVIFIPLTFLAGVYGMNFDRRQPLNMPELGWPHGYLLFWAVCAGLVGALLLVFRRLGWLGLDEP